MQILSRIGLLAIFLVFNLSLPGQVQAAFSIDRQLIEFNILPGEQVIGKIGIINYGSERLKIIVSPVDYRYDKQRGVITPPAGSTENSLLPYFILSRRLYQIEPGSAGELNFQIRVPRGVEGSRWLALYFEEDEDPIRGEEQQAAGSGLRFDFRVKIRYRTLILVTVRGTEIPGGLVKGMKLTTEKIPAFQINYQNTGNIYYRVKGKIDIRDEQGETAAVIPIGEEFFLPGQESKINVEEPGLKLAPGRYLALAVFDYGGERLVAGQLEFTLGDDR